MRPGVADRLKTVMQCVFKTSCMDRYFQGTEITVN